MAGLLAALCVVLVDLFAASDGFPWPQLVSQVRPVQSVYWGVTRDRAELRRSRLADAPTARVAILGSSRGHTGFRQAIAENDMPGAVFVKLAHALQDPVTVHALVPELIAADIDVAVLTMSHVDTHRPVRLEPLPAKSTARIATLWALVDAGGSTLLRDHRTSLYRILASAISNLYRFRDNLGRAGANTLREFPLDPRLEGRRGMLLQGEPVLGVAGPTRLQPKLERRLLSGVAPEQRRWVYQLAWFAEVRRGAHMDLQFRLLEHAVAELREAGVAVVVAECPVHAVGKSLEQPGSEADFRRFASALAQREGVWFLPLPVPSPYKGTDYMDLFHLNEAGAARFTRAILRVLPEAIAAADLR